MAKTRLDGIARTLNLIEDEKLLAIDAPVRMDDLEVAEDLFGDVTDVLDLVVERICTAQPTGHRTWNSYDRETDGRLIINTDPDYILS